MTSMTPMPPRRRRPQVLLFLALLFFLSIIPNVLSITIKSIPSSHVNMVYSHISKRQAVPEALQDQPSYTCTVIGECHACSALQVQTEESCKETHNRQRIECKYDDPKNDENEELKIRLPTYRSCLRVKAVEARRFAHFLTTNILLALFTGILVAWRKRKLAAAQYRRLARRIGIA